MVMVKNNLIKNCKLLLQEYLMMHSRVRLKREASIDPTGKCQSKTYSANHRKEIILWAIFCYLNGPPL